MWAILAASVSWLVSVLVLPVARAAPTTTDARLDNFDYDGIFKLLAYFENLSADEDLDEGFDLSPQGTISSSSKASVSRAM